MRLRLLFVLSALATAVFATDASACWWGKGGGGYYGGGYRYGGYGYAPAGGAVYTYGDTM